MKIMQQRLEKFLKTFTENWNRTRELEGISREKNTVLLTI